MKHETKNTKEQGHQFKKFWVCSVNNYIVDADYSVKDLKSRCLAPSFRHFYYIKNEEMLNGFCKRDGLTNKDIVTKLLKEKPDNTDALIDGLLSKITPDMQDKIDKEMKEDSDNWKLSKEQSPQSVGHTPGELTLLVTGSGNRSDETENELLLRTDDATLHFKKDSEFGKLARAIVNAYNAQPDLLEALKETQNKICELYGTLRKISTNRQLWEEEKSEVDKIDLIINKATKQ